MLLTILTPTVSSKNTSSW